MNDTLTITRTVSATPRAVYRAFTTPGGQMDWFANAADIDARVGGRFYVWTDYGYQAMGAFTALEEDLRVAFEIYNPDPTRVEITLQGEEGNTVLTLGQEKFRDRASLEAAKAAWESSLDNLKSVLENGIDSRFYDRPMLGVLIGGQIDKENYRRFKLPVEYGIHISGTVPGMGAEAAGLRDEDVLVEMAGVALKSYHDISEALQPHKAGDTIRVAWYRGGRLHEAHMTLSGRPIPEIPATPQELADEIHSLYARQDAELMEILDDVTEAEAEYRPDENEWNIKEIIAHLITTEKAVQIWIANTAEGRLFQSWATSDNGLVKSVVDIHATIPHLLAELRRTEGQTVALLRRLPAEIVDFKGAYHNITTSLGKHGLSIHAKQHFETVKGLIEEVRRI